MKKSNTAKLQATLDAALEVAAPIFVSTLATVIVFLPVIFLTGIAKLLFTPLVITITVALFTSFFVSRTVSPLLCFKVLGSEHEPDPSSTNIVHKVSYRLKQLIDSMDTFYERSLGFALR